MAILWADGFDHYGSGTTGRTNMLRGAWSAATSSEVSIQTSSPTARTGLGSLQTNTPATSNPALATRSLPTGKTALGVAMGLYRGSLPDTGNVAGFCFGSAAFDGGNFTSGRIVTVTINADGSLNVYLGNSAGTLLDVTNPGTIVAGSWNHVEAYLVISTTLGYVEIRVNGETVSALSELNTGSDECTLLAFGKMRGVSNGGITHWDDIIAWDTQGGVNDDFLGAARVYTTYPAGDLSPFDWAVVGAASGAAAVDDTTPDDDTTYIGASEVGEEARFSMPTLPDDVAGILGIWVPLLGKQEEAGITEVVVSMVSDVSGEDVGPTITLTTSYTYRGSMFELNPNGDEPWTKATFEAASLMVERTV